jgi:CheY-like chemotaxis protein
MARIQSLPYKRKRSKLLNRRPSHESIKPFTILLIDDNDDEAVLMSRVFENRNRKGYRLLHAREGKHGVLLAQQESPDVIICDLVMPEIDGFYVVEALRNNANTFHIPIIISSARDISPKERKQLKRHVNMVYEKGTLKPSEFALRVVQAVKGKKIKEL